MRSAGHQPSSGAVATVTALNYMSDNRAEEWWAVLSSTERAWADAYLDRRSPLALLPREVPQPIGFVEPRADIQG